MPYDPQCHMIQQQQVAGRPEVAAVGVVEPWRGRPQPHPCLQPGAEARRGGDAQDAFAAEARKAGWRA